MKMKGEMVWWAYISEMEAYFLPEKGGGHGGNFPPIFFTGFPTWFMESVI